MKTKRMNDLVRYETSPLSHDSSEEVSKNDLLRSVAIAVEEIHEASCLDREERILILERLSAIDGQIAESTIRLDEVAAEAHLLAFESFKLLREAENEKLVSHLMRLDLECEAFYRVAFNKSRYSFSDEQGCIESARLERLAVAE